eukprot:jgi/Botrbrau1/14359/Bobra.0014s0014.1
MHVDIGYPDLQFKIWINDWNIHNAFLHNDLSLVTLEEFPWPAFHLGGRAGLEAGGDSHCGALGASDGGVPKGEENTAVQVSVAKGKRACPGESSSCCDVAIRKRSRSRSLDVDSSTHTNMDYNSARPSLDPCPLEPESPASDFPNNNVDSGMGDPGRGGGFTRRPSMPGFGGIAKGVIQAANATVASGRAPIKSLEELYHQKAREEKKAYKGVARSPWSVTWDAHMDPQDGQGPRFLGTFPDADTAARAHDVALLHARGAHSDTNFKAHEYMPDVEELQKDMSLTEFIIALQRFGAFGSGRHSRYKGVYRNAEGGWEARYPNEQADASNHHDGLEQKPVVEQHGDV